ncbi:hypothetical protein LRP52_35955 [Photobacterium sp. ZSDE20]|uniref:Uncharacterized protein n=1 Tax=Photobacterium pectinilyticum TaxID=2906793 RepID=A0ABT1N5U4_9GAMM|nr:hypothetical protein [Photobacterium sp. ZSDE20]MCQ1060124.1 hypothetical protein [Photobacterium sp. ZSDE20]MDD1827580.1 hypothetical protein [Photobacterium sp. ZSDE20]
MSQGKALGEGTRFKGNWNRIEQSLISSHMPKSVVAQLKSSVDSLGDYDSRLDRKLTRWINFIDLPNSSMNQAAELLDFGLRSGFFLTNEADWALDKIQAINFEHQQGYAALRELLDKLRPLELKREAYESKLVLLVEYTV